MTDAYMNDEISQDGTKYCEICDDACTDPAEHALSSLQNFYEFKTALYKHLRQKHRRMCNRKGYTTSKRINMTNEEMNQILETN